MAPNRAKQPNEVDFVYFKISFLVPSIMMIDFCDDEATAIRGVEESRSLGVSFGSPGYCMIIPIFDFERHRKRFDR